MISKHRKAIERLRKALDAACEAGLRGGVYDCSFYVWPVGANPDPRDTDHFFKAVRECGGELCHSRMKLDGGAGV